MSRVSAEVTNGVANLAIWRYRIRGTVTIDGHLTGVDLGNPLITFEGEIAGPFFGKLLSGILDEGVCRPHVEMTPLAR